jgi:hypothetical protein
LRRKQGVGDTRCVSETPTKETTMAANTTTVTHADGTVSKRTSKTRSYTHAIEASPAPAADYAAYLVAQAVKHRDTAATLRAAADAPQVSIRHRGLRTADDLVSHTATLAGTDIYTLSNAAGQTRNLSTRGGGIISAVDYLTTSARENARDYERRAGELDSEAAEVLAKGEPVFGYGVLRWSSRRDLAEKALKEFEHATAMGCTVRVVPVD